MHNRYNSQQSKMPAAAMYCEKSMSECIKMGNVYTIYTLDNCIIRKSVQIEYQYLCFVKDHKTVSKALKHKENRKQNLKVHS